MYLQEFEDFLLNLVVSVQKPVTIRAYINSDDPQEHLAGSYKPSLK